MENTEILSIFQEKYNVEKSGVDSYENLTEIPRISANDLLYETFFLKYLANNLPVIIALDLSEWDSYTQWIKHSENILNIDYLKNRIGNVQVPVAKCSEKYFDSHRKIEMKLFEYLNYWCSLRKSTNNEFLYLKDWHLQKQLPDYKFYTTPKYFSSDFLNEYLIDTQQDDYKFCYIGPAKTYTPLHADVFSSYSWSVNIFGRKHWLMIPPGEEEKLRDSLGNLPFLVEDEMLKEKQVKYFKLQQESSEAIFVPSNWHHQVVNEVDTISINHNWFNACNLKYIWQAMQDNHVKIVKEIEDCKEMERFEIQCQVMLKSLFGMDFQGFLDLLKHITEKRIRSIKTEKRFRVFNEYIFDKDHLIFDLKQISAVVQNIVENKNTKVLGLSNICAEIISQINEVLNF